MMRLFITGGSSYLGQHLVPLATQQGLDVTYTFFSADPLAEQTTAVALQLDLRDDTAVQKALEASQPDAIIHLAGSNRTDDMSHVITAGAKHITHAARAHEVRLVHLSTDVIFDGQNAPYDETAVPMPLHAYGQAKAEAEASIQTYAHQVIVRTSLIYGLRHIDRSMAWIIDALQKGEAVTLFDNQWRNPVWVMSLAHACLELAITNTAVRGVLNVAGNQAVTRAELGLKLLDWWQIPPAQRTTLAIAPAPANAPWPPDTRLVLDKALRVLRTPLPGLDEVLAQADKIL